jgi:hypothetical protein
LDVTSFSHDEEEVRRVNTVLDDARSAELGSASRISDASARASAEPPTHEALLSATRAASQRRLTTGQGVRPNFMRHTMVGPALQRFASEYFDDQRRRCMGAYLWRASSGATVRPGRGWRRWSRNNVSSSYGVAGWWGLGARSPPVCHAVPGCIARPEASSVQPTAVNCVSRNTPARSCARNDRG